MQQDPGIQTIIVSGLSGSGKTTAIRALEDIGYLCMDNLPVVLLGQVIALCERGGIDRVAAVTDVRERLSLTDYERTLAQLRADGYDVQTLFLTAEDEVLIRRFKETRRKHPLQGDGTIADGIHSERAMLSAVRSSASWIVDILTFNVHALRRRINSIFRSDDAETMHVRLESFGFKHGAPREADYVFDVRFLPNPFFVAELREGRGTDTAVSDFVHQHPDTPELIERLEGLIDFVLPRAERDGRGQVTIAIGCTGGHHRSVAVVERLREHLRETRWRVSVIHRDIDR